MTVVEWLLDSDPSIRWQVMRDITHEPAAVVAAERARIASDGWGARLLALQAPDGLWGGGTLFPEWTSTTHTLLVLRYMGLDPLSAQARRAVALVRDNAKWEHAGQAYFAGEVEPCINGKAVAIGAYFGEDVSGIVDRLLGEQLGDGGWNCEAERGSTRSSFNTTIDVLEGLLQYERSVSAAPDVTTARRKGEAYLLDRRMFRRLSTGAVVDPQWLRFSFPPRYFYDVLRGLDHLRSADVEPDERVAEAIELVKSKRSTDGHWPLENPHPGAVYFDMDDREGKPSRWNTLRAMRVLAWHDRGPAA
ncbi:MAG TPA: hypothetical protein VGA38_05440 [Candidatus Limnocylindria bacterium]